MKKFVLAVIALHLSIAAVCTGEVPSRIVSLAPNLTEILFAMGLGDRVVGVTSFCDYPEEAKRRQKVGGMSNPSLEAVVSLKPDLVVVTTDGNPMEFEERLRSLKIKTYVFRSRRLRELPQGVRGLGAALGVKEKGDALAEMMEYTIRRLGMKNPPEQKRKVLFIVWPEPLIVAGTGTVIDDAITLLSGENIAAGAKGTYPKYSVEEILHNSPDVILIGKGQGHEDMEKVSKKLIERLKIVPAVRNGKVFFVSDLLYRLGPRTFRGIEEVAEYIGK
jgi:ABC-type Fe3+-hydroxamate transport system substrate-binding protein